MWNAQFPTEWTTAIDAVIETLLDRADLTAPPINALQVAKKLNIPVVIDQSQSGRGRCKTLSGKPTIFVRQEERPERLQWTTAHELGELIAWQVIEQIQPIDEITPQCREEMANQIASRLLLPTAWFNADAQRTNNNILQLKKMYHTASHELIALRLLDQSEPTIITIIDNGRITRRKFNGNGPVPQIHNTERFCAAEAHRENQPTIISEENMTVQGWPVHEERWRREILRTTLSTDPFAIELLEPAY